MKKTRQKACAVKILDSTSLLSMVKRLFSRYTLVNENQILIGGIFLCIIAMEITRHLHAL